MLNDLATSRRRFSQAIGSTGQTQFLDVELLLQCPKGLVVDVALSVGPVQFGAFDLEQLPANLRRGDRLDKRTAVLGRRAIVVLVASTWKSSRSTLSAAAVDEAGL